MQTNGNSTATASSEPQGHPIPDEALEELASFAIYRDKHGRGPFVGGPWTSIVDAFDFLVGVYELSDANRLNGLSFVIVTNGRKELRELQARITEALDRGFESPLS